MSGFSTPAIMLRRIDHGDFDLIIHFFTYDRGKVSVIAKSAKKSVKRFAGSLELFSVSDIVCAYGRGRGLPVLQEASLKKPFDGIRCNIKKTAYASYWAELINLWIEEGSRQAELFVLLEYVLGGLDMGDASEEELSLLFQMRFLKMAGLSPNLSCCSACRSGLAEMKNDRVIFDLAKGGVVCKKCASNTVAEIHLSQGTIKQLMWVETGDLKKAGRVRFSPEAIKEGGKFLEAFVPYHLGKAPRSLEFLKSIR